MISYLRGKIVVSKLGQIVLDVSGVGYRVGVSSDFNFKNGEMAEFFIYEHIREDVDDLYGFKTFDELELFEKLISVNGVGPKAGLNIMSAAKPQQIVSAISRDDLSFFTAISGVGKKVAAKIILDLKSKISGDRNIGVLGKNDDSEDVLDALCMLGYKKIELSTLITKIPQNITTVEQKVTWCLKNLGK